MNENDFKFKIGDIIKEKFGDIDDILRITNINIDDERPDTFSMYEYDVLFDPKNYNKGGEWECYVDDMDYSYELYPQANTPLWRLLNC